ncbi:MAG TPA: DUF4389 domain-containing protein [Acidimicrobiales bacterium]|nr:DUF4389 domain-containing protein [Acidimicrobiales bacterium]
MAANASSELELRVEPRAQQRRTSVALRLILAIPQFIVIAFIGYAAEFLAFLGWFVALVTGRNPFHRFIVGYIRWYARVIGYLYFLTDSYPPFSLEPSDDYPIDVRLEQSPLRRLTILFRIVLLVPVTILTTLLSAGLAMVGVVAWFLTLVRGSLPEPLHNATHAALRYVTRVQAYALVVQDRYPRGLFGDVPSSEFLSNTASTDDGEVSNDEAPGTASELDSDAPTRLMGSLPMAPPVTTADAEREPRWPLSLSRAGRRVITGELILGAMTYLGSFLLIIALGSSLSTGRVWSHLYGGDLASLRLVVTNARADLDAASPNWDTVRRACTDIEQSLARLGSLPQYPRKGPNEHLLRGLGDIALGERACLGSIVPHHQTQLLADLSKAFAAGLHELAVFDVQTR